MTSVSESERQNPPRLFSRIYLGVVGLIFLVLAFGVLKTLFGQGSDYMTVSLGTVIYFVLLFAFYWVTPLVLVLALMTIWRIVRYRRHRVAYLILIVPLYIWIHWGINAIIHLPL